MKKSLLAGFMLSALFLGSCSSEEPVAPVENDGTVTFIAELPGSMSRAYSDGLTATHLRCVRCYNQRMCAQDW